MKIKKLKLKKKEHGATTYSLVNKPAIKTKGILFSAKDENDEDYALEFKIFDKSKHQIISPLIIPNFLIEREGKDIGEDEDGLVLWDDNAVDKDHKHLMMSLQSGSKLRVDHKSDTDNAYLLEIWKVRHPDTDISCDYFGKNAFPKNTLMTVTQITDDDLWAEVEAGKCGISIEGDYALEDVNIAAEEYMSFSEDTEIDENNKELMEKIQSTLLEIFTSDEELTQEEEINLKNNLKSLGLN